MPFPSGRCRTCRARHLKCDENRPKCGRCQVSDRPCTWDDNEGSDVFFRDENAYASSKVKRQRGGARWSTPPKPRSPSLASASAFAFERSVYPSTDLSSRRSSSQSTRSASTRRPPLSRSPSESVKDQAVARLLRRYVCADSAMTAEIWGFIHDYQYDFFPLKDNSMLSNAIYALALHNYGRATGYAVATTLSQEHYSHAVSMTGNAVRKALTSVDDELILTVMLLSAYEDFSGSFDPPTLTSQGFHHLSGVTALMKLRRQQTDPATPRSQRLDQIVRRRIIRTSLYRGVSVPDYLQRSTGEQDTPFELSLNSCLIDVAALRSQALNLLNTLQTEPLTSQTDCHDAIHSLINEAIYVESRLKSWHAYLPTSWTPQLRTIPTGTFTAAAPLGIFYTREISDGNQAGFDAEVLLNRYRAARLVTNSILALTLPHFSPLPSDSIILPSIPETQSTIVTLADGICASVPYFFNCHPSSVRRIPASVEELIEQTTVPRPMQLVWPLVVASTQQSIPEAQRGWIREKIGLIARVAGSGTLEQIADVDLYAHQHTGMLRSETASASASATVMVAA